MVLYIAYMLTPNSYTFSPLRKTDSLRLFRVLPGNREDDLHCTILDGTGQPPAYQALSYVWGSVEQPVRILIDRYEHFISPNLARLLRQLRSGEIHDPLWADQISINQRDAYEKATQVKRMDKIFHGADRVVMYLGADPEGMAAHAIKLLPTLAALPDEIQLVSMVWSPKIPAVYRANLEKYGLPNPDAIGWKALRLLMALPYWRRCWIVQEVRLARKQVVVWGTHEVQWSMLSQSVANILRSRLPYLIIFYSDPESPNPQGSTLLEIADLTLIHGISAEASTLYELLDLTKDREATDHRDKVFSLYGMLAKDPRRVTINYQMSLREVFGRAAWQTFEDGSHVDVLSLAGKQHQASADERYEAWPTWLPKWQETALRPVFVTNPAAIADAGVALGIVVDRISSVVQSNITQSMGKESLVDDMYKPLLEGWQLCLHNIDQSLLTEPLIKSFLLCHVSCGFGAVEDFTDPANVGQLYLDLARHMMLRFNDRAALAAESPTSRRWSSHQQIADAALVAYDKNTKPNTPIDSPEWRTAVKQSKAEFWSQTMRFRSAHRAMYEKKWKAFREGRFGPLDDALEGQQSTIDRLRARLHRPNDASRLTEKWYRELYIYLNTQPRDEGSTFMHRMLVPAMTDRRFFLTASGRMGLGPRMMQPGDEVHIIAGSKVPFVLRPQSSKPDSKGVRSFEHLGDCYVYGVMQGEFMNERLKEHFGLNGSEFNEYMRLAIASPGDDDDDSDAGDFTGEMGERLETLAAIIRQTLGDREFWSVLNEIRLV